jgi:hypothetical protein
MIRVLLVGWAWRSAAVARITMQLSLIPPIDLVLVG